MNLTLSCPECRHKSAIRTWPLSKRWILVVDERHMTVRDSEKLNAKHGCSIIRADRTTGNQTIDEIISAVGPMGMKKLGWVPAPKPSKGTPASRLIRRRKETCDG